LSAVRLGVGRHPPAPRAPPSRRKRGEGWGGGQLADRVLYRDGLILVIDKPAGIAVHAGPGGGPNLESAFDELRFGLPHPPALAHRLDRDTSGCLVLGRHPKALRRLGALFAAGRVEKIYWVVVEGRPAEFEGRIETGLKKLTRGGGWQIVVDPAGQKAITDYRICGAAEGRSWLELRPRTGRTHQIRVHCAALVARSLATSHMAKTQLQRPCYCMLAASSCRSILPERPSKSPPRCLLTWPRRLGGWATKRY